jgi:hypothetical protein
LISGALGMESASVWGEEKTTTPCTHPSLDHLEEGNVTLDRYSREALPTMSTTGAARLRKAVDMTIAEQARAKAASKRKAAETASLASIEARVNQLEVDKETHTQAITEVQEENAALHMVVSELRRELSAQRDTSERLAKELKETAQQPLQETRQELSAAVSEVNSLKAQVAVLTSQLSTCLQTQQDHTSQLRDVPVLRAQQGFVQAAADRADLATAEQTRLIGELRAELAGLQQRHAALASSNVAEHGAHRQVQSALRSSAETVALQLESSQTEMGSLRANDAASTETCEKLKKAAKRHELLLHRLTEVRAGCATLGTAHPLLPVAARYRCLTRSIPCHVEDRAHTHACSLFSPSHTTRLLHRCTKRARASCAPSSRLSLIRSSRCTTLRAAMRRKSRRSPLGSTCSPSFCASQTATARKLWRTRSMLSDTHTGRLGRGSGQCGVSILLAHSTRGLERVVSVSLSSECNLHQSEGRTLLSCGVV